MKRAKSMVLLLRERRSVEWPPLVDVADVGVRRWKQRKRVSEVGEVSQRAGGGAGAWVRPGAGGTEYWAVLVG